MLRSFRCYNPKAMRRGHQAFIALVLSCAMQACTSGSFIPLGPGSAPPMNPPFDSYDNCIHGTIMDSSREACFEKAIQASHITLPAGTTAEQAYAKYKECRKKDMTLGLAVGPYLINGNNVNTIRQKCFDQAVQSVPTVAATAPAAVATAPAPAAPIPAAIGGLPPGAGTPGNQWQPAR